MTYTNYSASITAGSTAQALWAASSAGTGLFIQNLAPSGALQVLIVFPAVSGVTPPPIEIVLPGYGDWIDDSKVDPTAAVSVQALNAGHPFTAFRTQ